VTHQKAKASNTSSSISAIFFGNKGNAGRVCVFWVTARPKGLGKGPTLPVVRHPLLAGSAIVAAAAARSHRSLLRAPPIAYPIGTRQERSSRRYTCPLGWPRSKIHTTTEFKGFMVQAVKDVLPPWVDKKILTSLTHSPAVCI